MVKILEREKEGRYMRRPKEGGFKSARRRYRKRGGGNSHGGETICGDGLLNVCHQFSEGRRRSDWQNSRLS